MSKSFKVKVLEAIGSTEPSTFNEICRGLDMDCPTDRKGWAELFEILRECEQQEFVEIDWLKDKIDSAQLTEAGVAFIKNW